VGKGNEGAGTDVEKRNTNDEEWLQQATWKRLLCLKVEEDCTWPQIFLMMNDVEPEGS
jgi:hypothetical protein